MKRIYGSGIVALLFFFLSQPANAALIQWNLENVKSFACASCGFAGFGPNDDTLTGYFIYDSTNDAVPSWNITSKALGLFSNIPTGLGGNDSVNGIVSFEGDQILLSLFLPSPDIPLLSGSSPITLIDASSVAIGAFGFEYAGTLVATPLPTTLSLFVSALLLLGVVVVRSKRRLS